MSRRPSTCLSHCWRAVALPSLLLIALTCGRAGLHAQAPVPSLARPPAAESDDKLPPDPPPAPEDGAPDAAPDKVDVQPFNADEQIAARIERILKAAPWFESPTVQVDEGVVFLRGQARTTANKNWAGQLATKTQDVVAVVNLMEVVEKSAWDFTPAWEEIRRMGRLTIQSLPGIVMATAVLIGTWFATRLAARAARHASSRRVRSPLLRDVIAKGIAIPVLLLGVYLAMQLSGLTRLAATVLGGTGIIGLVLGIAFRDIAENFLASILISIQRPFLPGDLILVAEQQGYVEKVTSRGTVIMTLEGNHVQVPNSTIYKSIIRNFTANPNTRLDFVMGIAYQDDVDAAQEVIRRVLVQHEAVLADPEPLVLVEELGLAPPIVRLHAYFWINARDHSTLKVRSALMRLAKSALQTDDFVMPDVPRVAPSASSSDASSKPHNGRAAPQQPSSPARATPPQNAVGEPRKGSEESPQATTAEGELRSEKAELKAQAAHSRELESGADLLRAR
jgi:small conductance mechanosensitive channel